MPDRSRISVARYDRGVCIRVEGAGTVAESPVMHAFAERVLANGRGNVIIDLGACNYLDSTFLGGLVSLFKREAANGGRFAIYAPAPARQSLFSTSRLDRVFPFVDELPAVGGECLPLEAHIATSRDDLGQYVVECHRRLAELGGPEAETFGRVADAIANEITTRRGSQS
ncbi:MAG TPA: STAS domain-containing protein [Polyangia bacterium]